jgi:hypothetical protein
MSTARHHADWLSLVEVSGPFVSLPVLLRAFPQGLEPRDPAQAKQLRAAYEDWQDHPTAPGKQLAWVLHVLCELLGYPANQIAEGQSLPAGLEASMAEQGETLRPDFALISPAGTEAAGQAQLLICSYPADQLLDKPVMGKHWKATPATRMMELLHGTNVPLGLVANGEQWMLVYAPRGETTGYASWYGALWLDEPITLRAFQSLLGSRRFFGVAADSTLLALLKESASDQQEVTDQLGYQVRDAVEVLMQSFDAIHQESQGAALKGIPPAAVYDAALTIMMRLVFLFSAEERGLLHLGKPLYDDNYAVSTLQEQLQEVADRYGEEVLERRYDAWARLLASFRAVHGGIQHQDLLMQAYGGSLFDPDRYPFLEGRTAGSTWRSQSADPLPVNNRVVLHLLNSLQRLRTKAGGAAETRRVSFRALGVEQIGHVYEGLLDHTAQRATEVVLGIRGTRNKEPEIPLSILEQLLAKGEDELLEHLKEETGRSVPALRKELNSASDLDEHKLLVACRQDEVLLARLRPFAGLVREDSFERPWVVLPGSVFVTAGTTRRSTGTHYTPPSLTEPIVRHTLEPLVYAGPAEGLPKEEWKLKSPKEILALKVCDMAMGSGAFLVQACRYLAERLVEAWENEEKSHPGQVLITPEGKFSEGLPTERLVPAEAAERIAIARRVVADRCLYGVDINPMAVEMAKLSMWLITVDKNRPFTFLDHAFKCGDSLLGITSLEQLENFSMRPDGGKQRAFATLNLSRHIDEAKKMRQMLEAMPSDTPDQIETKESLYGQAEEAVARVSAAADALIAVELRGLRGKAYDIEREAAADHLMTYWVKGLNALQNYASQKLAEQRCLHWALTFPEIIGGKGFDAFIGNPPYMGGKKISAAFGSDYREFLTEQFSSGRRGNADICAFFLVRAVQLSSEAGCNGFVATSSIAEGETREIGLDKLLSAGVVIYRAADSSPWPGVASVTYSPIWLTKRAWEGQPILSGRPVSQINSSLKESGGVQGNPEKIIENKRLAFIGSFVYGEGFVISKEKAAEIIASDEKYKEVCFPYMRGDAFNSDPSQSPDAWVINFFDWPLEKAETYPKCLEIVRNLVKPVRDELGKKNDPSARGYAQYWWQYGRRAVELYKKISLCKRVLFHCFTSKYIAFDFAPANIVFAAPHVVVALESEADFAVLQSSIHESWVRHHTSYLSSSLRYTPSDCFETFVRPNANIYLEMIGGSYRQSRKVVMQKRSIGLTNAYNEFNNPSSIDPDIKELRNCQIDMDMAVAAAYGWQDLSLDHGFHETKQGIRFTISEAARREVLDRLLALNHQRYTEEVAAGLHGNKQAKPIKTRKPTAAMDYNPQDELFDLKPTIPLPARELAPGARPIIEFLRANPGWHSKDEILTATGFPDNRWSVTIRELLDSGQVNRQGEKRGAKYRLAGNQN